MAEPAPDLAITGLGVVTPIGQGAAAVQRALRDGVHAFGVMARPGRQHAASAFLGAELAPLAPSLARASLSCQAALATVAEARDDAGLDRLAPERVGLVVGGSNLQQRDHAAVHDGYRDRMAYLRPGYGQTFLDSDIAAACSERFAIRGPVHTAGGASASGHLAVIEACRLVAAGEVDACIAVGGLMDLSAYECQALRALGAMGSDRFGDAPAEACRPFDAAHDGFVFGEACAAIVVERAAPARYATITGWSWIADGRRGTDPSRAGEVAAIRRALAAAGIAAAAIDYVNPHGTGSPLGDATELAALAACDLRHARLNATKALVGHGLTAAGAVELVATCLQIAGDFVHPTRNLAAPIDPAFAWVGPRAEPHRIEHALNLSFGFGGISSAICLRRGAKRLSPAKDPR